MSNLKLFNQTITNENTQNYLMQVLGEKKSSFVNNLTALVANNAKLQECEPLGLMYAGIKATALDLPLDQNLGFAYVIPYKNNREQKTEAQFQIGYKGFKQLAIRSGQFRILNSTDVREGEVSARNRLTGEMEFNFIQDDKERMSKPVIGFVCYFELLNGFSNTLYMSVEELKAHGLKYSQTYKSTNKYVSENSKWNTDFDAMALKTVTKLNLSRNAPLSVEMQQAVMSDQAILGENDKFRYVDNDALSTSEKLKEIASDAVEVVDENEPTDAEIENMFKNV